MIAISIQEKLRHHSAPTGHGFQMTEERVRHVLKIAKVRARLLVTNSPYSWDEWQDIQQEQIVDLLRRTPKFDPARGGWESFVRGVMRNHSSVLRKRKYREASRGVPLKNVRSHRFGARQGLPVAIDNPRTDERLGVGLSLDVRRAISSMPIPLQILAGHLIEMNVAEVCRLTGRSRSRVYQMIRQTRAVFSNADVEHREPGPKAARRRRTAKSDYASRTAPAAESFTHVDSQTFDGPEGSLSVVNSEEIQ